MIKNIITILCSDILLTWTYVYILVTPKEVVFANSEDSDEMLHSAAFHQILHYLLKIKTTFVDRRTFEFGNSNLIKPVTP